MVIEAIFWASLALLLYTYAGYPVLAWVWATIRARPATTGAIEPTVTVIVVAYNEAVRIGPRIENLLALDYPPERLDIVVASDGSTDTTAARARAYEPRGVSTIAFEDRRGKPSVLNDLLPKARGEIVVLADARQRFEPDAIRALVGCFADPCVGAVTGELVLRRRDDGGGVGDAVGLYWRYEKFIRRSESRAESVAGVTGAIYAVRRELFEPIPADTILDDVLIPLRIARRGYRVLLEPRARAHDLAPATAREEFTRKVRTMAGKFQMFARQRWLLNPFANRLWLATISRNGLRLLVPFLLVAALGANLGLAHTPVYRVTLAAQLVFYGAALAGYLAGGARRRIGLLSVPYIFCLLNGAIVVGLARFVSGRQQVTWDKATGR